MTFFSSIQKRVTLLVLAFGLTVIGMNAVRNSTWLEARQMSRVELEADQQGTMLSGMLQHCMRRQLIQAAELQMSYLSLAPGLRAGAVVDNTGVIRYATRLDWVGLRLEDSPLGQNSDLVSRVQESLVNEVQRAQDSLVVNAAYPFYPTYNPAERAALLLRYDAGLLLEQVQAEALRESAAQAAVLLALSVLVWLVLDELISQRVTRVLALAEAASTGAELPAPLQGQDELARVSQSFAAALRQVQETDVRLLDAAENERRRMGADIHDDVCQRIAAAQLRCGVLGTGLAKEGSPHAALAQQVAGELAKAASVARGYARGLAPVSLEEGGLELAVRQLAEFMQESFGLLCSLQIDLEGVVLTEAVEMHVHRILQELATNAAKHGKASWLRVSLSARGESLCAEVEHDGLTFDGHATENDSGLGLSLVRQRVRALAGTLRFGPRSEGTGTLVLCELPVVCNPVASVSSQDLS